MNKRQKIHIALFALYAAMMALLLFNRALPEEVLPYWQQLERQINLIPGRTILHFGGLLTHSRPAFVRLAVINLLGNVIMFVPLGHFLPEVFIKLRAFWKTLLASTLAIVLVEIIQLLTLRGTCDIDDLLLNLIGAAGGYGLHYWSKKAKK